MEFEKVSFKEYATAEISYMLNSNILSKEEVGDLTDYASKVYEKIEIPVRATARSAGYDFSSPIRYEISNGQVIKIPTGIKAKLDNNCFLQMVIRSSMGFKGKFRLINQVGIIDADYYNNENNEGHIYIGLENISGGDLVIEAGEKIAQGVILGYFTVEDDMATKERNGGFGSTGK